MSILIKERKEVRALVVQKGCTGHYTPHSNGAGSNLLEGPQDNYSSDVFSSVGFQDLKAGSR